MRRFLISGAALVVGSTLMLSSVASASDPVSLVIMRAKIQGNTVTVPVQNNSMSTVTVDVLAQYDDGSEVHSGTATVTLQAKGSALVSLSIQTITDDIDPQTAITEGPDPIPGVVALSTD